MIALEDLKGKTEQEIIEHLVSQYSSESDYSITEETKKESSEKLKNMEILIAYESVGNWGCDSSSFFVMKDRETNKLYEVNGSHCSCYGFEGQLDLEETTVEALKFRVEKGYVFSCGGYDDNADENRAAIRDYIINL